MSALPSPGDLVAGRYRVEAVLGTGGMGAVFRALELPPGADGPSTARGHGDFMPRKVALKFADPEVLARPGFATRFQNEALAAQKVASEHAVKIHGVEHTAEGAPFIVMELLEGHDLDRVIDKEAPIDPARAVHFALQILRALQVAHGAGVVHRDMKPTNCFVVANAGEADYVKLIDFGITKILGEEGANLTKTSMTLGTPAYMAPEQAKSAKSADARSDLYSVGVILYELLTRKQPYEAQSHNELVVKICTEPPIPLRTFRSDLPPKLVAAVERALVKSPAGRYASAEAFAAALKLFADGRSAGVLARIESASQKPLSQLALPAEQGSREGSAAALGALPASLAVAGGAAKAGLGVPETSYHLSKDASAKAFAQTAPSVFEMPAQPARAGTMAMDAPAAPIRQEQHTVLADVAPVGGDYAAGNAQRTQFGEPPPQLAITPAPQSPGYGSAPAVAIPAAYIPPVGESEPYSRDSGGGRGGLVAAIALLAICGIGVAVYFAFFAAPPAPAPVAAQTPSKKEAADDDDDDLAPPKKPKHAATNEPAPVDTDEPPAVSTTTKPPVIPATTTHPTTVTTTTATHPATTTIPSTTTIPTVTTLPTASTSVLPPATTVAPPVTTPTTPPTTTGFPSTIPSNWTFPGPTTQPTQQPTTQPFPTNPNPTTQPFPTNPTTQPTNPGPKPFPNKKPKLGG